MTPHAAQKLQVETEAVKPVFAPTAPTKEDHLDIPVSLVDDLLLRYLFTKASTSLKELSRSLKLSFPLLHAVFQRLRHQQYFEITGMEGNDYVFTLSGIGRDIASKRFSISHYAGPAPVSMRTYEEAVRAQAVDLPINRSILDDALKDLVLTDRFMDQLGPALASQKSIFIYGPTGNGKTSVVSRLSHIYQDTIVIPYSVEVDGQIIVLYDPAVHEKIEFDTNGPYAGAQIRLDGSFAYQFPMPLFQTGEQLWPVSSVSVKEQVSAIVADKSSQSLVDALFARSSVKLPENVPKIQLLERLPL